MERDGPFFLYREGRMTPEIGNDAQPAASSAAPLDPSTALAEASPEAYAQWQKTGDLPIPDAPEPSTSTPAEIDAAAPAEQVVSTDTSSKAASEPAKKDKTEQRFQELLADRARERERADRLEREIAALRTPAPPDARAASSPAPAGDPEPDPEHVEKYPDGLYDRKFMKDQAEWVTRNILRTEREAATQAARQQHQEARARESARSWAERVNAARAKDPEYDSKAFTGEPVWKQGSTIDVWIMGSSGGAALLPYLMTHPEEARRIDALPVVEDQLEALVELKRQLQPAPAKQITDAPPVARTLGDRTAGSADAVARAIANKDPGAYIDEMNRRELAARRG